MGPFALVRRRVVFIGRVGFLRVILICRGMRERETIGSVCAVLVLRLVWFWFWFWFWLCRSYWPCFWLKKNTELRWCLISEVRIKKRHDFLAMKVLREKATAEKASELFELLVAAAGTGASPGEAGAAASAEADASARATGTAAASSAGAGASAATALS